MSKLIPILLFLAFIGSTTALGYVRPEKECVTPTVPVLYMDRWSKRDCDGLSLSLGTTDMRDMDMDVYGHTLYVPLGYEVRIVKEPLFRVPREILYREGSHRYVSYAFWDTRIETVHVYQKVEKTDGL